MSLSNSFCCQMTSLVKNMKYPIKIRLSLCVQEEELLVVDSGRNLGQVRKNHTLLHHIIQKFILFSNYIIVQFSSLARIFLQNIRKQFKWLNVTQKSNK